MPPFWRFSDKEELRNHSNSVALSGPLLDTQPTINAAYWARLRRCRDGRTQGLRLVGASLFIHTHRWTTPQIAEILSPRWRNRSHSKLTGGRVGAFARNTIWRLSRGTAQTELRDIYTCSQFSSKQIHFEFGTSATVAVCFHCHWRGGDSLVFNPPITLSLYCAVSVSVRGPRNKCGRALLQLPTTSWFLWIFFST